MAYGEGMTKLNPCSDGLILDSLRTAVPDATALLDLACGRGERLRSLAERWPGLRLRGIDADEENLSTAGAAVPDAELVCADAARLPYADGVFDIVLCECSFSLFAGPAHCAAEISRVLRKGGVLLLTDLCAKKDRYACEGISDKGTVKNVYGKAVLEEYFAAAGLTLERFEDRSGDMTQMLGQMLMDGTLCGCLGMDALLQMKKIGTGYGLWLFRKLN